MISPTGDVVGTYYYDAFGNVLESPDNANNPYGYAGYQYDKETGLYYLNSRMYDPYTARFLQEDTYRGDPNDPLSLNLYTYCVNNPLVYYDPTGHWPKFVDNFVVGFEVLFLDSEEERKETFELIEKYGTGSTYEQIIVGTNKGLRDVYEGVVTTGEMVYDTYKDPVATYNKVKDDIQWLAKSEENREIAWQVTKEMGSEIKKQVIDFAKQVDNGDPEAVARLTTNLVFMFAGDKGFSKVAQVTKASKIVQATRLTMVENVAMRVSTKVNNVMGKTLNKVDNVMSKAMQKVDNLVEASTGVKMSNMMDDFGKIGMPTALEKNAVQKAFIEATQTGGKKVDDVVENAGKKLRGSPTGGSKAGFGNNPNIVRRAVTPEQAKAIEAGGGIIKETPFHKTTPTQHVAGTKHSRNPWTSTTRRAESAEYFATHGGTRPANPIVEIDLSKLNPENILDVSTAGKAAQHLKTPFTRNAASFHQEVLIKGDIPAEAIRGFVNK